VLSVVFVCERDWMLSGYLCERDGVLMGYLCVRGMI
jgi:hypothetical protein